MKKHSNDNEIFELIPELPKWNNGRGIDLESWIRCVGNYEHAIGYGQLFWPEFVEHDGCVFFKDSFDEKNYQGFMQQTGCDKRAVETVMNHRHLSDWFCAPDLEPSNAQLVYLGRLLKDMWQTKLNRDFPDKTIIVSFPEEALEDSPDYEITFFQHRQ